MYKKSLDHQSQPLHNKNISYRLMQLQRSLLFSTTLSSKSKFIRTSFSGTITDGDITDVDITDRVIINQLPYNVAITDGAMTDCERVLFPNSKFHSRPYIASNFQLPATPNTPKTRFSLFESLLPLNFCKQTIK